MPTQRRQPEPAVPMPHPAGFVWQTRSGSLNRVRCLNFLVDSLPRALPPSLLSGLGRHPFGFAPRPISRLARVRSMRPKTTAVGSNILVTCIRSRSTLISYRQAQRWA